MQYINVKQSVDTTQSVPQFMLRDEFIIPNVKKELKIVKGERPIEVLIYYDEKGTELNRVEQFWLPSEQDMKSAKWITQ